MEHHINLPKKDLSLQGHLVIWLKIRLLAERAKQMEFSSVAEQLEENWGAILKILNIREDYYASQLYL